MRTLTTILLTTGLLAAGLVMPIVAQAGHHPGPDPGTSFVATARCPTSEMACGELWVASCFGGPVRFEGSSLVGEERSWVLHVRQTANYAEWYEETIKIEDEMAFAETRTLPIINANIIQKVKAEIFIQSPIGSYSFDGEPYHLLVQDGKGCVHS